MRNITSENIAQLEKKAPNKTGLILTVIIVIIVLISIFYILYQNKDKINWEFTLPWQKEAEQKEDNPKLPSYQNEKIEMLEIRPNEVPIIKSSISFKLNKVEYTQKGYKLNITFKDLENFNTILKIKYITVDGYFIDQKAEIQLSNFEEITKEFLVSKSELDKYGINGFRNISIFIDIDQVKEQERIKESSNILWKCNVKVMPTESRKNFTTLYSDVEKEEHLEYYDVFSDASNHYIYFKSTNRSFKKDVELYVKELKINNEVYEMKDFKETNRIGSKILFYLKIPKKHVKSIKNFEISFFIIKRDKDKEISEVYITDAYNKKL